MSRWNVPDLSELVAGMQETSEELTPYSNYPRSNNPSRRRDRGRRNHHQGTITNKPFVSWDGEAAGDGIDEPQDYCLIGNSADRFRVNRKGALHTVDILEFMLSEGERLDEHIHVAFGFNYDVNHIIRHLPFKLLKKLYCDNYVYFGSFRLEWFPSKWFSVTQHRTKRHITVYDTIGFWATSLLGALKSDPMLAEHPEIARIESGKHDRGTFRLSELDGKVIPYFKAEMKLHAQLMEHLRGSLREVNLVPRKWYGPSAVISDVYTRSNLKDHMNRPVSDLTRPRRKKHGREQKPSQAYSYTLPDGVNEAARYSFAGGRFEQFKIGYHEGPVYGYDITSAYPHAMLSLPSLRDGRWTKIDRDTFKQWRKQGRTRLPWGFYCLGYTYTSRGVADEVVLGYPHPLFCRDEYGRISYPFGTSGWYPSHSAQLLWDMPPVEESNRDADFTYGWIFEPATDEKPFHSEDVVNFQAMFDQRQEYRNGGRDDLSYALKITLNSGYGKTAQRKGVELGDNLPAFHQLEWASHITDHCRTQIWEAAVASWNDGGLVAIETDAIYSTTPLSLERKGLGGWKEGRYDGICYLQSGVYFTKKNGEWTFHMRGLEKDSLSIEQVREHLHAIEDWSAYWPSITGRTHTFNSIGYSRIDTSPELFKDKWLKWLDADREIKLGLPGLKRAHIGELCSACKAGVSPAKGLHDLFTNAHHAWPSHGRRDAWIGNEGVTWGGDE